MNSMIQSRSYKHLLVVHSFIERANMSIKNILLSLAVIGILVTVLIFATGRNLFGPSKGTWFIAYPQGTDAMATISDETFEFKLDNMSCGVTKTQVAWSEDERMEYRELYCWTSDDTYVSTTVNCDMPKYSSQALAINKKNTSYMPLLMCGPEKKGINKS